MPAQLQPVRGTHDLLPDEARRHRWIEDTARANAALYGYGEIVTPIFEFTEVFSRTLGETSDVVTKEMYTFALGDDGESLTLRPEGTAGVARAFISGGLAQNLPLKLFYRGPMFRRERPQKGRQRQFHQVGAEYLGIASPLADVESIAMAWRLLSSLGLSGQVKLELNTLGSVTDRTAYRDVLREFLRARLDGLSPESRDRVERNPLRVLDSKNEGDRRLLADAPSMAEHIVEGREFFEGVTSGLTALGIPFEINPRLVRGLDYYCHTVFEFTTTALGAQGTVLAGGRYDGLVEMMGGPSTPGIGWAAGVERLSMLAGSVVAAPRPIAIIPMGDAVAALTIAERVRAAGHVVELGYSGNFKRRLERANKLNARAALILGVDEAARGAATLKDLDTGVQEEVPLSELETRLARFR